MKASFATFLLSLSFQSSYSSWHPNDPFINVLFVSHSHVQDSSGYSSDVEKSMLFKTQLCHNSGQLQLDKMNTSHFYFDDKALIKFSYVRPNKTFSSENCSQSYLKHFSSLCNAFTNFEARDAEFGNLLVFEDHICTSPSRILVSDSQIDKT